MKKKIKEIADLLPEGLSEKSVADIANLINELISEEVNTKIGILTSKVHGFLRLKMDKIKEAAIEELSEDNDVYKDAQAFRTLRNLMALEITPKDSLDAVEEAKESIDQVTEENKVLASELNNSLIETTNLSNTVTALQDKVKKLESEKTNLNEKVEELTAQIEETDSQSTGTAVLTIENVDTQEDSSEQAYENPFISDEMLRLTR